MSHFNLHRSLSAFLGLLVVSVILVIAVGVITPVLSQTYDGSNPRLYEPDVDFQGYMRAEDSLEPNDAVYSRNEWYFLVLQEDGNLVLYSNRDVPNSIRVLWSTGTNGASACCAVMQGDGNFVLYSTNGRVLWASDTEGNPGAYLGMQNDGNLVIYSSNDRPLWATGTEDNYWGT